MRDGARPDAGLPEDARAYLEAVARCSTEVPPWRVFVDDNEAILDAAFGRVRRMRLKHTVSEHLPRLFDELGITYDAQALARHLRGSHSSWTRPRTRDWMGLDAACSRGEWDKSDRVLARWVEGRVVRANAEDSEAAQELDELFGDADLWLEDGRVELAAAVLTALARAHPMTDLVVSDAWARDALIEMGGFVARPNEPGTAFPAPSRLSEHVPHESLQLCAALSWLRAPWKELRSHHEAVTALVESCAKRTPGLDALRRRLEEMER